MASKGGETLTVRMARIEEQLKSQDAQLAANGAAAARVAEALDKWEETHLAFIKEQRATIEEIQRRQDKTDARVNLITANARAFAAGFGAAFMLIGAALGAGINEILGVFKA